MRQIWNVISLDVWGNEEDGWEINDIYRTRDAFEFNADDSDQTCAIIKDYLGHGNFEFDAHEENIFITCSETGKPLFELELDIDYRTH